jgi:catechol 2,3-dioxygenase-like lactoylglutathione lyase family enzyme
VTLSLDTITFDCADPKALVAFWAAALGMVVEDEDDEGAFVLDPARASKGLFFQKVPEPKAVKDRIHLDVRPSGSMAAEVARLKELGATEDGLVEVENSFWTIMLDPEGNEFCVLRGPEDGWVDAP